MVLEQNDNGAGCRKQHVGKDIEHGSWGGFSSEGRVTRSSFHVALGENPKTLVRVRGKAGLGHNCLFPLAQEVAPTPRAALACLASSPAPWGHLHATSLQLPGKSVRLHAINTSEVNTNVSSKHRLPTTFNRTFKGNYRGSLVRMGNYMWWFLQNLNTELAWDPAIPHLSV